MALDLIKNTLKYTIFLGLIGLFIAWAFELNNGLIQTRTVYLGTESYTIRYFDWFKYTTTLSNAWTTNALDFTTILPPRTWDDSGTLGAFINNVAYLFDWIYFPINFLAYILRWVVWIFRLALALIGWDFTQDFTIIGEDWETYNSALIKVLTWITQNLMIPYV